MTTEYKAKRKCAKCGKKIGFYEDYTIDYHKNPKGNYFGKPLCGKCSSEEKQ